MILSQSKLPGLHGTIRDLSGEHDPSSAKLKSGDIVVVSMPDLSRVDAQRFIDAGISAVINTRQFSSGTIPNFGPQMLLDMGMPLIENFALVGDARLKKSKKGRLEGETLYYGSTELGSGQALSLEDATYRFNEARVTLGDHIEALVGNTAEFVRSESPLLIDGLGIPDVDVDMYDRKVLIASPTEDLPERLHALKNFIREYDPILIGVESAADYLMQHRLRPDVVVGDPETMSTETLRSGAVVILPADPAGHALGLERIQDLGVGAMTFPAATRNASHLAMLVAHAHGASLVVHAGPTVDLDYIFSNATDMDTPSALLTPLRLGAKNVDSHAIAELYRVSRPKGGWLWALLAILVAIAVIVAIAGFTGEAGFVDNLIATWNSIALRFQSFFT